MANPRTVGNCQQPGECRRVMNEECHRERQDGAQHDEHSDSYAQWVKTAEVQVNGSEEGVYHQRAEYGEVLHHIAPTCVDVRADSVENHVIGEDAGDSLHQIDSAILADKVSRLNNGNDKGGLRGWSPRGPVQRPSPPKAAGRSLHQGDRP